jgi:ELKS/RAB6-interacting/CAST family protein 1
MAVKKGKQAGKIHDLKDMLDVKECKVNILQKKTENLQEQLRGKEKVQHERMSQNPAGQYHKN